MIAGSIQSVTYYNPDTQNYQASPLTVQLGTGIQIAVAAVNNSDAPQTLGMSFDIIDPNGTSSQVPVVYTTNPIAAGAVNTWALAFIPYSSGTWKVTAHLSISGTEVDSKTVDACYVQVPTGGTQGTITTVQFLNPATGAYQATAPAAQVGQNTQVGATGNNLSTASQNLQLVFVITKPDGTQVTINGQKGVKAVAAGTSFPDTTPAITLDQTGVWKVEVKLMSDSTQLATTGQLTMATVSAAAPTTVDMSALIAPMISLAMMMMMFSMLAPMMRGFGEGG